MFVPPDDMTLANSLADANSTLHDVVERRVVDSLVPEERQSDQPILLSVCKAELGEVSGHEREQHQTKRQFLIPSPLQTKEEILRNTG